MFPYPVICLAGPTACGKTGLSLSLAQEVGGEILNADSRQVYADFPILCAQPSEEEKKRFPHHLFGFLETNKKISAGEWCSLVSKKLVSVRENGHVPILVGGTGMYFHSLLHGIVPIPEIDPEIRDSLEKKVQEEGSHSLYTKLCLQDPLYAAKIHPNDRQRVVRALEVLEQTGHTFSWWHNQTHLHKPFCKGPLFVLDASLTWLEPRIAKRISLMLENGGLEEGRRAYEKCQDPHAPGWSGIGCFEVLAYLLGRIDWDSMKELWQKNTRAYAKRQNTWFRGHEATKRLDPSFEQENIEQILSCWRKWQESHAQ